jgi:hypothetical protein
MPSTFSRRVSTLQGRVWLDRKDDRIIETFLGVLNLNQHDEASTDAPIGSKGTDLEGENGEST